jgi:ankyrin repeat protein
MKHNALICFFSHVKNLIDEKRIYHPILKAINQGDNETLLILLEKYKNFDINYTYQGSLAFNNETLLYKAVSQNKIKIVELLIAKGADVNLTLPLHAAYGIDMVKLLLECGANPNLKNNLDIPIFHDQFYKTQIEEEKFLIFKTLLDYGANPNIQDSEKETIAHYIFKSILGKREIKNLIPILLEYGAQLDIENEKGKTPLDCIKFNMFISDEKEIINYISTLVEKIKIEHQMKNQDSLTSSSTLIKKKNKL